jgi:hypothetical protein
MVALLRRSIRRWRSGLADFRDWLDGVQALRLVCAPDGRALAVMLVTGLFIDIGTEWVAIKKRGRWACTVDMPLLPGLDVGLVPVLQMLLRPPVIRRIAARCRSQGIAAAGKT